jgi:hypothetical protein
MSSCCTSVNLPEPNNAEVVATVHILKVQVQVQVQVCFTSVDGQVQPLDVALQP